VIFDEKKLGSSKEVSR
ncbi:hypothetical protein Tco_0075660, partial [Tanacetum coccineum]